MITRPRHFQAHELVDPVIFRRFGDTSLRYFRPELLRALDAVWQLLNTRRRTPIICNNWRGGGPREWSGYRTARSPYYSEGSAHSIGAAADLVPVGMMPVEAWGMIRDEAAANPMGEVALVRRVEDPEITKTWLHLDVMEHNGSGIQVVRP